MAMSSQETMLSDLSGFEFEELMMDVFRNLGYENIRNPGKTGDEGRDIIMEKTVDGVRKTFIVECKNLSSHVGRPVVQKLHSAVATFDTENQKVGMIVTTNRFSAAAKEYAEKSDVRLWDGKKIREIAEDIGLDLYNGEIEIVCNRTLPVPEKRSIVEEKIKDEFSELKNFEKQVIDDIEVELELVPAVKMRSQIDSVYETTVGVVNRIQREDTLIWRADTEGSVEERKDSELERLIHDSGVGSRLGAYDLEAEFDDIKRRHFEKTETGFKQDLVEYEIKENTEQVSYTGGNNVTYNKTHKPKEKDVTVTEIKPVYVPKIKTSTRIKEHSHRHSYFTDNNLEIKKKDEIHVDTHTGRKPLLFTPTLCRYCGTINNRLNIKEERLNHSPICKHCSETERFMLRQKHFASQENLENFRENYKELPFYRKVLENKLGLAALGLAVLLLPVIATV
ncbi:Restriction endonuclease [Candidatus Nanohalococcus occultus]|uniref:Restriction endonuclease n=2 Tax=Candidatus Nanohalococcus occultus TaxID=2978047 RepID=A0ABY8CEZ6_9ARCH|nr:Restriction endonuclease [Candidatus Nanohaloarchaeota archaeon SVXNc]